MLKNTPAYQITREELEAYLEMQSAFIHGEIYTPDPNIKRSFGASPPTGLLIWCDPQRLDPHSAALLDELLRAPDGCHDEQTSRR